MPDPAIFWREVRRLAAELPEIVMLHSACGAHEAGENLVEVSRDGAAEALTRGTHRLATEVEIERFKAQERIRIAAVDAKANVTRGIRFC